MWMDFVLRNYKMLIFHLFILVVIMQYTLLAEVPLRLPKIALYTFHGTKPLRDRITYFDSETLKIFEHSGKTFITPQDERQWQFFTYFHNPDKYTFYKILLSVL